MLNHLNSNDYLSLISGFVLLMAVIVILGITAKRSSPSGVTITGGNALTKSRFRFHPGTWVVAAMQIWAMHWTCLYRSMDAFVVEWRASKKELLGEILKCEDE